MDTAVPDGMVELAEIQGMSKVTPKHVNIALAFAA